jgi:hypothetical protein
MTETHHPHLYAEKVVLLALCEEIRQEINALEPGDWRDWLENLLQSLQKRLQALMAEQERQ